MEAGDAEDAIPLTQPMFDGDAADDDPFPPRLVVTVDAETGATVTGHGQNLRVFAFAKLKSLQSRIMELENACTQTQRSTAQREGRKKVAGGVESMPAYAKPTSSRRGIMGT